MNNIARLAGSVFGTKLVQRTSAPTYTQRFSSFNILNVRDDNTNRVLFSAATAPGVRHHATSSSLTPLALPQSTPACASVLAKVDSSVSAADTARLFAIVHIQGKQYRVTEGDLIVLRGAWAPDIGDRIRLEKVLLVGGADFTLLGRPLLKAGLVNVEATVVAKELSHTVTRFIFRRRKDSKHYNFVRVLLSTLRINRVTIEDSVSQRSYGGSSTQQRLDKTDAEQT